MPQWSTTFTKLIRERSPRLWGNWSLGREVKLGAVGVLAADGAFRPVGELGGIATSTADSSEKWRMSTNQVRRTQSQIGASGGASGVPAGATGATLGGNAEVQIRWEFARSNELVSEFNVSRREAIRDLSGVVASNKSKLQDLAQSVHMRTAGSIDQGFGVVTGVVWAKSGANIASLAANSKFAISGKADLLASFLGAASANVALNGAYSTTTEEGNLDTHLWPESANAPANAEVPLAFEFASFEGEILIPGWTGFIQSVVAEFRNTGSYIAAVTVKYRDSTGLTEETYAGISGGLSRQIMMPLDATDVEFAVSYVASGDVTRWSVGSPLMQSRAGRLRYEIRGLWPDGPTVVPV